MQTPLVDTDVVSFLFKQDSRAALYTPHLKDTVPAISFAPLAGIGTLGAGTELGQTEKAAIGRVPTGLRAPLPGCVAVPKVG